MHNTDDLSNTPTDILNQYNDYETQLDGLINVNQRHKAIKKQDNLIQRCDAIDILTPSEARREISKWVD